MLDFSGSSNLDELHDRLRATCLLRREKKQALPELADKVYLTVAAEITNRAEYDEANTDFVRWLENNKPREQKQQSQPQAPDDGSCEDGDEWGELLADILDGLSSWQRSEALQKITYLRQLSGVGKIAKAADWITQFLAEHPSLPIRLTQTPTTCWVRPIAGVEFSVGRRLSPARDPQQ